MPALSTTRTYDDGEILLDIDTDAFIDDIEALLNTTKLDNDNFQDNSITANTKLVAASITATELGANSVESVNIAADAVTDDKLAADCAGSGLGQDANGALEVNVDDSTVEINAGNLRVKDAGITATKIADNAITTAKLADDSISRLKFTGDIDSGTGASASLSLTTNGGKVLVSFANARDTSTGQVELTRNGATIETFYADDLSYVSGAYIDSPSAGTYTYAIVSSTSGVLSPIITAMEI